MSSEVRSSGLKANLSSNTDTGGVEMDTAVSKPLSSRPSISTSPRPFHALYEECSLREDTFLKFKDGFQFPDETRVYLPRRGEKSCAFAQGRFAFMKLPSCVALGFPSIHS